MAVGILYCEQISFINIFDPSRPAGIFLGPNALIFLLLRKSTTPFTRGTSGPTTTKSIFFVIQKLCKISKLLISILCASAICDMP